MDKQTSGITAVNKLLPSHTSLQLQQKLSL